MKLRERMYRIFALLSIMLLFSQVALAGRSARRQLDLDDEFEGFDDLKAPPTQVPIRQPRNSSPIKIDGFGSLIQSMPLEACAVALLLLAILNYYSQKKMYTLLMESYFRSTVNTYGRNFSRVDFGGKDESGTLLRESASCFLLYASGRINIRHCVTTIDLVPRQNIFIWFVQLFMPYRNTVTLDATLRNLEPVVLLVSSTRAEEKKQRKQQPLIDDLHCDHHQGPESSALVLGESKDLTSKVLALNCVTALTHSPYFISLLVADKALSKEVAEQTGSMTNEAEYEESAKKAQTAPPLPGEPHVTLTLQMPPQNLLHNMVPLLCNFFECCDEVSNLKIPERQRTEFIKTRSRIERQRWQSVLENTKSESTGKEKLNRSAAKQTMKKGSELLD